MLAWLTLVGCMSLAGGIVVAALGLWSGGGRSIPGGVFGAWLWVAPTCLMTALVGPFYLSRLDDLLQPRFPVLRPGYLAYVAGPGLPFALPMIPAILLGWPAYPIAYVGIPALLYEVTVLLGALLFAAVARPFGLFGHEGMASEAHDERILRFFRAWTTLAIGAVIAAFVIGCVAAALGAVGVGGWAQPVSAGVGIERGLELATMAFAWVAVLGGPFVFLQRHLIGAAFPFLRPGYVLVALVPAIWAAVAFQTFGFGAVNTAMMVEAALLVTVFVHVVLGRRWGHA